MLVFVLFLALSSCQDVDFSSRPTNVSILLLHFTQKETQRPTVLGSFGLWSLLSGISFGAAGDSGIQIFRALLLYTNSTRFNLQYKDLTNTLFNVKSNGVDVSNRNYMFIDKGFYVENDFKKMLIDYYDTSVTTLDFEDTIAAANVANGLVETHSAPVKNVFSSEDFSGPTIIMSNVLFFKGLWTSPFDSSKTLFKLATYNGKTNLVPMMHKRAKVPYSHMDEMKANIMELSYGDDGKYCMIIITPDPNVSTDEVYQSFETVTFDHIFAKLRKDINETGLKEIDVTLPRFGIISKLQLHKPFNDMGIYDPFERVYAKFHRMVRESIYIETIEHNAVIMLTESGTIAYATTPGINFNTAIEKTDAMTSLIFFIMEKATKTVLFSGIFQ